jgi:hypothetical protein
MNLGRFEPEWCLGAGAERYAKRHGMTLPPDFPVGFHFRFFATPGRWNSLVAAKLEDGRVLFALVGYSREKVTMQEAAKILGDYAAFLNRNASSLCNEEFMTVPMQPLEEELSEEDLSKN